MIIAAQQKNICHLMQMEMDILNWKETIVFFMLNQALIRHQAQSKLEDAM